MSTLNTTNLKNPSSGSNNVILNTDGTIGGSCLTQTCRAWVNFNGTGTVAIRASYNVSSITDNAAGNYVVNFTTAMSDANYNAVGATNTPAGYNTVGQTIANISASTCSVVIVGIIGTSNVAADATYVSVAIFR